MYTYIYIMPGKPQLHRLDPMPTINDAKAAPPAPAGTPIKSPPTKRVCKGSSNWDGHGTCCCFFSYRNWMGSGFDKLVDGQSEVTVWTLSLRCRGLTRLSGQGCWT